MILTVQNSTGSVKKVQKKWNNAPVPGIYQNRHWKTPEGCFSIHASTGWPAWGFRPAELPKVQMVCSFISHQTYPWAG